ncbi:MAG: ABC transporter ATP-binding protein [Candidatus Saccharimonadales bacterium]
MSETFNKRDREAARYTHRLFWRATFVDGVDFIIWALTRPLALLIYNVLIPFEVAYGLQSIITRHFNEVNHFGIMILLLGIAYCVLWTIGGVVICRNGRIGSEFIQREVFVNYLEKDYEFFNNTFLGALGSQATRLREAYNSYCTILMNGITKQIVVVVTSIAIIAYQSPVLALVTLVSMTAIMSFTIASSKWRLKYRRLLSEASSETAGIIGDALGNGVTVKSFAAEGYEIKHLDSSLKTLTKMQYWSWMSSIPADVGRMLLAAVATLVLLLMTAKLYQHHSISIALVVLVQLYVIKLVMATQDIADLIKQYEAVMSSAHQAVKTMLLKPTLIDRATTRKFPKRARFNIALDNISYRYEDAPKTVFAVKDFSLNIVQGEKVGLVGYSGSGKTTLTKLLLRFSDVVDGSIKIDGIDIRDMAQKDLRAHIAYVPQEPLLFHRSIAENIAYGKPDSSSQAIREAGEAAYIREFVDELSKGYDTFVGEKGVKLSGGQRQRVAIARALLKDAPILVLDEATSALDSRSEQFIQKALWKLMEGRTAIVIAHRLSTIQHMDRIIVMDKGRIMEVGAHKELLERDNGIYAKLWEHQSGGYIVTET